MSTERRSTPAVGNEPRTEAGRHLIEVFGTFGCDFLPDILAIEAEAASQPAAPPIDVEQARDALDAQAELLVCYRIGKHPSGRLLDRVGKANDLRARLTRQEVPHE